MNPIEDFLLEIDRRWRLPGKVPLRLIGSAALLLQVDYDRLTKDADVLETQAITPDLKKALLGLAGAGTELARSRRLYLEVIQNGVPFLPLQPRFHAVTKLARLEHFSIEALDVVDVAVSKLKRFNANDAADIAAMVNREKIPHADLVERFVSAVDAFSIDARAEDLPKYVRNLHAVERDYLGEYGGQFASIAQWQ